MDENYQRTGKNWVDGSNRDVISLLARPLMAEITFGPL